MSPPRNQLHARHPTSPARNTEKASKQQPFADTTSLAVLRQRIDEMNRELIDALAEVCPRLAEPSVQQALPQRAEEILTGDSLAEVRETAIAPLQRGPRK